MSNNSKAIMNLQVTAAEANPDVELALGNNPLLANNIPVAQIPAHKLKADALGLTLLKVHLLEAAELTHRSASRGGRR